MNKKIIIGKIENHLRFLPAYMFDDYKKEKLKKERLKKYKKLYGKL